MKFRIIIFAIIILFPIKGFAYKDISTHPGLTQEIVDFYNIKNDKKISESAKEFLIKGSIDEDNPPIRSLNHFFDPIRDIGINDFRTAKDWALNGDIISNDYSWPKIIKYYAEGDEQKSMFGLGHILHLVEDMAVPDHTRNDPHIGDGPEGMFTGESSYEKWAGENKNRQTMVGMAENIKNERDFSNPEEVFDFLAKYSNENFFSDDTITSNYNKPKVAEYQEIYGYGEDYLYNDLRKLIIEIDLGGGLIKKTLFYNQDFSVLSSYFSRLSEQAIIAGSGLIELFFKEALPARQAYEKEKREKLRIEQEKAEVLYEELSKKGTVGLIASGVRFLISDTYEKISDSVSGTAGIISSGFDSLIQDGRFLARAVSFTGGEIASVFAGQTEKFLSENKEEIMVGPGNSTLFKLAVSPSPVFSSTSPVPDTLSQKPTSVSLLTNSVETEIPKNVSVGKNEKELLMKVPINNPIPFDSGVPAGFGGGGNLPVSEPAGAGSFIESISETKNSKLPISPLITSPLNGSLLNNGKIIFSGEAESGVKINVSGRDSFVFASPNGKWSLELVFPEGENEAVFFATDSTGNNSLPTIIKFRVDFSVPKVSLALTECVSGGESCLAFYPELNFFWQSVEDDLSYFLIDDNGIFSTTTATKILVLAQPDSTRTFSVSAFDLAGNQSATSTIKVKIDSSPVVINEVAWAGTDASAFDEWIELYNRTDYPVDLSSWRLEAEDGSPSVQLSGTLPAKSFYLIERKNSGESDEIAESPIKDVPADLWTSFGNGLSNDGERLVLLYQKTDGSTTTADEILYCQYWCNQGYAGRSKVSMERVDPFSSGAISENWKTAFGQIGKGKDVLGGKIKGSPKAKNTISHLINNNVGNLRENLTLTKENSPYIVYDTTLRIWPESTLTLESGVVVKFYDRAQIVVDGMIKAEGSLSEPVVFTAFSDDDYGGDFDDNGSGVSLPGSWIGVRIENGAGTSTFSNAIFRFAGKAIGSTEAGLEIINTPAVITGSVFEKSSGHGLVVYSVEDLVEIKKSTFRDNKSFSFSAGLKSVGGSLAIEENIFENNNYGFDATGFRGKFLNNIFFKNAKVAGYFSNLFRAKISGNSGEKNGLNGLSLVGELGLAGEENFLGKNFLPYVIEDRYGTRVIPSGATTTLEAGAILKFGDNRLESRGAFLVSGSVDSPVIFTDIGDDTDGVDVLGDGLGVPKKGGFFKSLKIKGFSRIENSIFRYFEKALVYEDAPIDIENLNFEDNNLAIEAVANCPILRAVNVIFNDRNNATSTIPLP